MSARPAVTEGAGMWRDAKRDAERGASLDAELKLLIEACKSLLSDPKQLAQRQTFALNAVN